jgi:hypothetical protein
MAKEDEDPVLSIGLVLAGNPSDRLIWDRMAALGDRIESAREGVLGDAKVNVIFYVPGRMLDLDFTGSRTARISRGRRLLMIQVAFPTDLLVLPVDAEAIDTFMLASVVDGVAMAEEYFRRKGLDWSTGGLSLIIERLKG